MRTILPGILLAATLVVSGCTHQAPQVVSLPLPVLSQVPVPTAYPLQTQQKMQAARHWEVLAEDVACRVREILERRVLERQFPVYVAPSGTTPFAKSFHALLITKLVDQNVAVASGFTNALVLSFDIEMIRHADRLLRTDRGLYKALAPGVFVHRAFPTAPSEAASVTQAMLETAVVNVESGIFTIELPRTEVMITSSLVFEEVFLMRDSSIYFINDSDWWHYKQHALPIRPGLVTYQLVDH